MSGFGGFGNTSCYGQPSQGQGFGNAQAPINQVQQPGFGQQAGAMGFNQPPVQPIQQGNTFGGQQATMGFGGQQNQSPAQQGFGNTGPQGTFGGAAQMGFGAQQNPTMGFGTPQPPAQPYSSDLLGYELPSPGQTLIYGLAWNTTSSALTVLAHSGSLRTFKVIQEVKGILASGLPIKAISAEYYPEVPFDISTAGAPSSGVFIDETTIMVGTTRGKLRVINVTTGAIIGEVENPGFSSPVLKLCLAQPGPTALLMAGVMEGVVSLLEVSVANGKATIAEMSRCALAPLLLRDLVLVPTQFPTIIALTSNNQATILSFANNVLSIADAVKPSATMKFPVENIAYDPSARSLFMGSLGRASITYLEENQMTKALSVAPHGKHWSWQCHRTTAAPNQPENSKFTALHKALWTKKNKLLTSGGDGTMLCWDVGKRNFVWKLNGGEPLPLPIRDLSLSPNDELLAYACSEEPLQLIAKGDAAALAARIFVLSTPPDVLA